MTELCQTRDDAELPLAHTGVDLLLELRGEAHVNALAQRLNAAAYPSHRNKPEHGTRRLAHPERDVRRCTIRS